MQLDALVPVSSLEMDVPSSSEGCIFYICICLCICLCLCLYLKGTSSIFIFVFVFTWRVHRLSLSLSLCMSVTEGYIFHPCLCLCLLPEGNIFYPCGDHWHNSQLISSQPPLTPLLEIKDETFCIKILFKQICQLPHTLFPWFCTKQNKFWFCLTYQSLPSVTRYHQSHLTPLPKSWHILWHPYFLWSRILFWTAIECSLYIWIDSTFASIFKSWEKCFNGFQNWKR